MGRRRPTKIEFNQPGGAIIEAALDTFRPGWRGRAEANRSWWKPIETLLVIALWVTVSFVTWRYALWGIHLLAQPHGPQTFTDLYQHGTPGYLSAGAALASAPLLYVAGIVINLMVGLVPPLRRVSERGCEKFPELTLVNANRKLAMWGLRTAFVAAPLSLLLAAAPG